MDSSLFISLRPEGLGRVIIFAEFRSRWTGALMLNVKKLSAKTHAFFRVERE